MDYKSTEITVATPKTNEAIFKEINKMIGMEVSEPILSELWNNVIIENGKSDTVKVGIVQEILTLWQTHVLEAQ